MNKKPESSKKNNKFNAQEDSEFEKHLQKLEDPNYEGETNFVLSKNASALEKSKYEVCQKILGYKQDNHLTTEQVAKKMQLSVPETKEIFLAHLDKFTLDRLMVYASQIFSPSQIKLTIGRKGSFVYA